MKIGIQTWGSQGDIRPFIALAAELSTAGHEITLAVTEITNQKFTEFGERLNFSVRHIGHIEHDENQFKELTSKIFYGWNPLKKGDMIISNFFNPAIEDMLSAAKQLCKENDLVIGHFFIYPLKIAALQQNCPFMTVFTTPLIPSRFSPPLGIPEIATWMNPVWWRLFDFFMSMGWKKTIDPLYIREGVPCEKSLIKEIWRSSLLNMVSVSPALFPPQPDWENQYHSCGFFDLPDKGETGQIPEDLKIFLDHGPAPVYITFGSMIASDPNPEVITALLIKSVQIAECRAIIQSNWEDLSELPESKNIYRITHAPHQKIFPQCVMVVHHGGAGTTHAATLSGCPSLVVEHFADQPLWGNILERRGLAPKQLHRRNVTSEKLAKAIKKVLNSPEMSQKAKIISATMQKENGVAGAVELIEKTMANL